MATMPANKDKPGALPLGYDKLPLVVLAAFAAYIITWFMQLGSRISFLGAIRFEFLLGIGLILASFFVPRQRPNVASNLYAYIAWFLIALLTQIPFSANVEYSWLVFVDRVVKFAFMGVFIVVFVRSPTALRFFIGAFLLAWFKMGQEGLTGQITGSLVWQNQGVMRLHGVTGLYEHPNSFSGLGLGMLPFIYYFFPLANRWQKIFLLVLLAFALNIILYTGSRTGYVGFLLFATYVFFRSKYKWKMLLAGVILGVVALPMIPQQYIERFASITGSEKEGQSKYRRIEILQDAVTIFSEHPFGVGVAAFPFVRQERFGRTQDTHNLYLEVATNLGIQGFIIWAVLIIAVFKSIRRLSNSLDKQIEQLGARGPPADPKSPLAKHLADLRLMQAILLAASGYIVIRLSIGFFGMDLYEVYWWFTMGIVIAIHNMNQVAERLTADFLAREPALAAADDAPQDKGKPKARPTLRGRFSPAR
jgi:putative inorganic carbon (hco3(-)) transporter